MQGQRVLMMCYYLPASRLNELFESKLNWVKVVLSQSWIKSRLGEIPTPLHLIIMTCVATLTNSQSNSPAMPFNHSMANQYWLPNHAAFPWWNIGHVIKVAQCHMPCMHTLVCTQWTSPYHSQATPLQYPQTTSGVDPFTHRWSSMILWSKVAQWYVPSYSGPVIPLTSSSAFFLLKPMDVKSMSSWVSATEGWDWSSAVCSACEDTSWSWLSESAVSEGIEALAQRLEELASLKDSSLCAMLSTWSL